MKNLVYTLLAVMMLFSVGIVSAQDPTQPPDAPEGEGNRPFDRRGERGERGGRDRVVLEIVANATGLTEADIVRMWRQEDMTLADIITSNGGDVAAVEAEITAALTEEINERMENLDTAVDDLLNTQPGERRPGNLREDVFSAVAEAAGLDAEALRAEFEAGMTLAEIASAHGLDVNEITATVTAQATERLNEAVAEGRITQEEADERLANLDEHLNEALNTTFQDALQHRLVEGALHRAVRESLDIERGDVGEIPEGQTLAEFIAAQGGDVAAITATALTNLQTRASEAVEEGRITQEQADQVLSGADAEIAEILSSPFEPRRPRDRR